MPSLLRKWRRTAATMTAATRRKRRRSLKASPPIRLQRRRVKMMIALVSCIND